MVHGNERRVGAVLIALVLALALWMPQGGTATPEAELTPVDPAAAPVVQSSLESGSAYDLEAHFDFYAGLDAEAQARVVKLLSRFVTADPAMPLPANATEPFVLKLDREMSRELRRWLEARGVEWISYVPRHGYVMRAANEAARDALAEGLGQWPEVLGTLLREPMDICDPTVWSWLTEEPAWPETRGARVVFYFDVEPAEAEGLLGQLEAEILEATTRQGRLTLATPFVDVMLTREALLQASLDMRVSYLEPLPQYETHNAGSRDLSNADAVISSPYNLTGSGEVVAIWDGGAVQANHADFGGRVTNATGASTSGHATHVMGTILGSGAMNSSARGYAPGATGFGHAFGGGVASQRRARRHASMHTADNHSYGSTVAAYGGYNGTAQINDVDNRDLLMLQVQSAGNSGPGNTTIRADKGSKNDFIIGATHGSGAIAGFSSRGPMNDGRLAPRFTAKGVNVLSAYPWDTYTTSSGTSMSGPGVCGGLTLLSEYFKQRNENMPLPADIGLAVLANTTIEVGNNAGPDYVYGFGLMDVEAAVDLVEMDADSNGAHIMRGLARQGSVEEYIFDVHSSSEPLVFTLAWLDWWAQTGASVVLVNDLDLELIAPDGTVHYPYSGLTSTGSQAHVWTQNGPNRRDNVIKTVVENPMVGPWRARVVAATIPDPDMDFGFVLAGNKPMDRNRIRRVETIPSGGIPLPDGSVSGFERTWSISNSAEVEQVRVYAYVTHEDRNDVWIELTGPNNETVTLEEGRLNDTHSRTDLIAILPDTRNFHDDMTPFYGISAQGNWTLSISDRDADGNTGEIHYAALEIEVAVPNQDPSVSASGEGRYEIGELVTLTAIGSDPDGHALLYEWDQIEGPSVALSSSLGSTVTLTTPSVTEITDLVYEVTAYDLRGGEASATVVVTVLPPNNPPVADAGPDRNIFAGLSATLDGSGSSDPDGDPLNYFWEQLDGEPVLLSSPTAEKPTFIVPSEIGIELTFQLTVDDDRGGVDTDTVTLTVVVPIQQSRGCATTPGATWGMLLLLMALVLVLFAVPRRRSSSSAHALG